MPTFSAAACPPHRLRIGFSDWCDSRPSAAMCGDHGSANPSGQVCAARGRRPAADRSALTRARIWLSYASVPLCGGGGGGTGPGFGAGLGLGLGVGLAPGLGVLRGVEVRVGAERGGGGTEVGAGVGGGGGGRAAASDRQRGGGGLAAGGDADGQARPAERRCREPTPWIRHDGRNYSKRAFRTRRASLRGRVHITSPEVVGCT